MKKKLVLLILIVCVAVPNLANAAWDSILPEEELGVELDATFATKYLWRGFDLLDDKAAFQPSVTVDFATITGIEQLKGFSGTVWASIPGASQHNAVASTVNATEYDYIVAYNGTYGEDSRLQVDYGIQYIYYDFIKTSTIIADAQEIGIGISLPNLCPLGVVPSYYAGKVWRAKSTSTLNAGYDGWVHIFGLAYDLAIDGFLPGEGNEEQVLKFTVDTTYNDGMGLPDPLGPAVGAASVDHDWSHMTWGLATDIALGPVTFTPAIYVQDSFDSSVNHEDEFYSTFSFKYAF